MSAADTVDTALFPNKLVKWHPAPGPELAGTLSELHLTSQPWTFS